MSRMNRAERLTRAVLLAGVSSSLCAFAANAEALKTFSVAKQPAASGVREFAHEADLQVMAAPQDMRGRRTNAVEGRFAPDRALAILIAGTGIRVVSSRNDVLVLAAEQRRPPVASARDAEIEPVGAALAIEEVIVTAQRREENLSKVPLSIQAFSDENLKNTGIKDLTSLQFKVPGYLPDSQNGFTQIFIRGVGNSIFLGADPSVSTFVDDVPQIYGSMVDKLVDVQRIEVLKGAQGGLYGRNATGGVVNVVTNAPNFDGPSGQVRASYGTKNTFEASGSLNLPLSDKIAWRIGAIRATHDPYVKNTASPNPYKPEYFPQGSFVGTPTETASFFNQIVQPSNLGDQDFWSVRSKLLIEAADDLSITLAGNYLDKHDNWGGQFIDAEPGMTRSALPFLFASLGVMTNFPAGLIQSPTGKFTSSRGDINFSYTKDWSLSATAVWRGPMLDVTAIAAHRNMKTNFRGDALTSTVAAIPALLRFNREYDYFELRGVTTFSDTYEFIGGVTYLDNRINGAVNAYFFNLSIPAGATAIDQKVTNWSAYLQGTVKFNDRLSLAASGRYIEERNAARFSKPIVSSARSTERKFVPSATLSYVLDDGLAYARWARGFKTGGINISTAPFYFPKPTDGSVFGPETIDTYEIGWRKRVFDRRVELSVTAFYNDYKNLQVDARAKPEYAATITSAIINAKSARTWGMEGSVAWRVAQPLTLSMNAGYLSAKYKDFRLAESVALAPFDLSGKRMTRSPKFQLSGDAALDLPINDKLDFVTNVLVSRTTSVIFQRSSNPGVQPDALGRGYWLVNARVGVKSADDRYAASLIVENLTNEVYFTSGNAQSFNNVLNFGSPRIVKAELVRRF